jgi:hypothetical protein
MNILRKQRHPIMNHIPPSSVIPIQRIKTISSCRAHAMHPSLGDAPPNIISLNLRKIRTNSSRRNELGSDVTAPHMPSNTQGTTAQESGR